MKRSLNKYKKFKLQLKPKLIFYNSLTEEYQEIYRNLKPINIVTLDSYKDYKDDLIDQISALIEDMQMKGSGFIFDHIEELTISISKFSNFKNIKFQKYQISKISHLKNTLLKSIY